MLFIEVVGISLDVACCRTRETKAKKEREIYFAHSSFNQLLRSEKRPHPSRLSVVLRIRREDLGRPAKSPWLLSLLYLVT